MDLYTLFFASYEVLLSLVFGLLTIFVSTKVLNLTFLKSDKGDLLVENRLAVSLFAGAANLCVMIMVHTSVSPSVSALQILVTENNSIDFSFILISFGYFLVFYFAALTLSLIVLFSAVKIYLVATIHIDEMKEIKVNNNVGVSVLIAAMMIGMTIFITPSIERFIGSLVNYRSLETYYQQQETEGDAMEGYIIPQIPSTVDE